MPKPLPQKPTGQQLIDLISKIQPESQLTLGQEFPFHYIILDTFISMQDVISYLVKKHKRACLQYSTVPVRVVAIMELDAEMKLSPMDRSLPVTIQHLRNQNILYYRNKVHSYSLVFMTTPSLIFHEQYTGLSGTFTWRSNDGTPPKNGLPKISIEQIFSTP